MQARKYNRVTEDKAPAGVAWDTAPLRKPRLDYLTGKNGIAAIAAHSACG